MQREIYLAGGCFWGLQHLLRQLPGVIATEAGFANGNTPHPTYEEVYTDRTGHAETVRVLYNDERLRLFTLINIYFMGIDPLSLNQQGGDRGTRYRTGVYYTTKKDCETISQVFALQQAKYGKPLAVELLPLESFYPADDRHQDYLLNNPTGYCHLPLSLFQEVKRLNRKIYFAGSIRGGRTDEHLYASIIEHIQKRHFVLTEHVGNLRKSALENQPANNADIYRQDTGWIAQCDILIAECTVPSLGVGYELAYAEQLRKPCHIFFNDQRCRLSAMIAGNKYFCLHPYTAEAELFDTIDKILP